MISIPTIDLDLDSIAIWCMSDDLAKELGVNKYSELVYDQY